MGQEIEIRFGNSWKQDELLIAQNQRDKAINLTNILDVVDVLIGGANISVKAPRDSIFLILRDLISRVEELLSRKTGRGSISFYESSWELVLALEADSVLLSFYRGGARPRVEVKDRAIGLGGLVAAVVEGGEALIDDLLALSPSMVADPFVSELLGGMERIKSHDLERALSGPIPMQASFSLDYRGRSKEGCPLSFGYEAAATSRDILAPSAPNRADLYCLMARGHFAFYLERKEVLRAAGYVFFFIEKLLEVSRRLLAAMEEHRDLEQSLSVEEIELDVRCAPRERAMTFSVHSKAAPSPPVVVSRIDPFAFIDEVILLARDLRRRVVELNPGQRGNLKFELFVDEIESLAAWRKDFETQTVRKQTGSPLRYEVPLAAPCEREEKGRRVLARTKKLMYVQLWEAQVEGLRLDASYLCGDRIVLTGPREASAVQRDTGEVLWKKPLDEPDAISIMTGESGILRFDPGGLLRLIDLTDGATVWSSRITPPFGAPAGIAAGGGRRPRYAVLTSGESTLVGVDLYSGEARWKHRTRRGSGYRFSKFGKLLFVTCGTNAVHCIDVDSGELVWRYCGRHKFSDPPVSAAGVVCAWGRDWGERAGRLYVFDGLSGEEQWAEACDGVLAASPVCAGGFVCAAFRVGHDLVVKAWKADTGESAWERDLGSLARFFSWMAVDDRIIMNVAGGVVLCMRADDGTALWSRNVEAERGEDVPMNLEPVLRGGGLFVPADTTYVFAPSDGTLLHRLDEGSPVPDFLRVDEKYSIYVGEVSGYFSAYGVSGHLGVIDG